MRTIFQQFQMRPPGLNTMAARLLNGSGRGAAQVVPVAKSLAPSAFFKRTGGLCPPGSSRPRRPDGTAGDCISHGVIAQPEPWVLDGGDPRGGHGVGGLSGLGNGAGSHRGLAGLFAGLGALSGDQLVQGVTFNHVWSMEDLLGTTPRSQSWMSEVSGGPRGLEYPPQDFGFRFVPQGTLSAARMAWSELNEAAAQGNTAAADSVAQFAATLQNAARTVDNTWDNVRAFIASRSPDIEAQRTTALKTISNTLTAIVQRNAAIQQAIKATNATSAGANAGAGAAAQQAAAQAAAAAAAAGASTGPNPYLIVSGIVALGVVAFVIRKKMS